MLFAYDAVAYYMWRIAAISKSATDQADRDAKINDGISLGTQSRNTVCKHGPSLTDQFSGRLLLVLL